MPQFCLLYYAILQSWRLKGGAMAQWPPPKYAPAQLDFHTLSYKPPEFQKFHF